MNGTMPLHRRMIAIALLAAAPLTPFVARAADVGKGPLSYAQLQQLKPLDVMHMIDTDKKGYVTREEFMKFQEQLFDNMDKNKDGKVDAKEWMGKSSGAHGASGTMNQ